MYRKPVLLVLVSVLLFSVVSGTRFVEEGVEVTSAVNSGQGFPSGLGESSVDWWPMFHHDLAHTGYSTSKAPKTNDTLWTSTISGNSECSSSSVADGRVYVGDVGGGYIFCFNASTGEQIWRSRNSSNPQEQYISNYGSPAVAEGRVFSGSYWTRYVHCLNASTGEVIWNFTSGGAVGVFPGCSPAVVDDRVYVGGNDIGLFCLNASTGEQIWYRGSPGVSSAAVVDGKLYCKMGNTFSCLNATTGVTIWNYLGIGFGSLTCPSSPAVGDGRVYVGGWSGVHCLNVSTGEDIWIFATTSNVDSSPALAGDKVYVGCDSSIYCLSASAGQKIWNHTTGNTIFASSPAVANGRVYIHSSDGKLYCLNALTGDLVWTYEAEGGYSQGSLSPAVADGKLYWGSRNGKVYCFGGHDVAAVGVLPSSTEAYAGQTINVTVTVRNEGTFNETFDVSAYYDSIWIGSQTVTDLAQDTESTMTFSWDTTGIAGGYYALSANTSTVPEETDTTNNIFTDGDVKITSPVRITEVVPCNQTGYPKGTFQQGTMAYVKVIIDSTALIPQNTIITVNLYDNSSITIGVVSVQGPAWPGISTIIFGLPIPATATMGTATVYANCYTDWPSQGGFPHCPEMSATLEITGP